MGGLYKSIERLSLSDDIVDRIQNELLVYKRGGGFFGMGTAVRRTATLSPGTIECSFLYSSKLLKLKCTCYYIIFVAEW